MEKLKKTNILVLGVGGNVGQGIVRAVRNFDFPVVVHGACVSSQAIGLYLCDKQYVSPFANNPDFIEWLIGTCNAHCIDLILTGVEEIIEVLAESKDLIEQKTNAIFISSSIEQLEIGNDKFLTCEWLKSQGCNYPMYADSGDKEEIFRLIERVGFPLIAKPKKGKGSSGIFIINDLSELVNFDNYVIQELIGNADSEYTVACYCNKSGEFVDMIIMKRRLEKGTTVEAISVIDENIYNECRKICEKFKPRGPLNIQLRLHKGKPVCFELNVRFSGTTPIRALLGYKDIEAHILEYIYNEKIENCFVPREGKVVRYLTEQIIDNSIESTLENRF